MVGQIQVPHLFDDHVGNLIRVFAPEHGLDLSVHALFDRDVKVGHVLKEYLHTNIMPLPSILSLSLSLSFSRARGLSLSLSLSISLSRSLSPALALSLSMFVRVFVCVSVSVCVCVGPTGTSSATRLAISDLELAAVLRHEIVINSTNFRPGRRVVD